MSARDTLPDAAAVQAARRQIAQILGTRVATATAEDTIIAKLEWAKDSGSERQLEDVAGILRVQGEDLDTAYIERWIEALGLDEPWRRARALTSASMP